MLVQDIPEDVFEAFRVKNKLPILVECKGVGYVEKWHLAKLDYSSEGIICWYETTCLGDLPVSFLGILTGSYPEGVVREITKKYRPNLNYLIKVRCGPRLYALKKPEKVEDDVSVLMRDTNFSLKGEFFPFILNIIGVVHGLWTSPAIEKRIYYHPQK